MASGPQLTYFVNAARSWHEITTKLGTNHRRHYGVEPHAVRTAFEHALLSVYAGRSNGTAPQRPLIHSLIAGAMLGIFANLFPSAKFVFLVRDVRAVAASLLGRDWRDPRTDTRFSYTYDPVEGADHWQSFNLLARPAMRGLRKAGRLRVVRYEDLCEKPGRTLADLAAFLQIDGIEKIVSPAAAATVALSDAGLYPPARAGRIVRANVAAWRSTLSAEQQKLILSRAGTLNAEFGYSTSGVIAR
jgi:hypothetical protein